jgi:hypothetical protein
MPDLDEQATSKPDDEGLLLGGIDLEMALAYVQVHSRKINAHVRSGLGYRKIPHPSGNFALELEKALQEARGCVAALERMIPGD